MNLLIFFIIILTIILIVCFYNSNNTNSASLIVALPLLGIMQYMNIKEETYNLKEYESLKKEGIIGSNDTIENLEKENLEIINLIIKYDSMPDLENKFKNLENDNKAFNDLNKYFLFKNDIIDPKILSLLDKYYKIETLNVLLNKFKTKKPQNLQITTYIEKNKIKSVNALINKLKSENKSKEITQDMRLYADVENKINATLIQNKQENINIIHYINTMIKLTKEQIPYTNNLNIFIKYEHGL